VALSYRVRSSLRHLDLSHNLIGDHGGKKIAHMILMNRGLKVLKLAYNQLGPVAGLEIQDTIRDNHSLEVLDLAFNYLPIPILSTISQHLLKTRAHSQDLSLAK